ncbi:MAG: nucleotidyl transferase AbiEii/AbiGii toxin family protein [Nanoarchaeota archaeon]
MENTTDLREEINRISNESGFAPRLIEKDYHLTNILHKISERKIENLVFKGGTCLNKCYLGFYRLSEDLDFVFNQDVKKFAKPQIRRILDNLRRIIFELLSQCGLEVNKELGKGWKMLTSVKEPKIIGLEIVSRYTSLLDESMQNIKIEISFRNKLVDSTQDRPIYHEFIDALGKPILKEDVKIESIDLRENFAEKFRALVTRKNIAIRDIFDIYFILREKVLPFEEKTLELVLIKINETLDKPFEKEDLVHFIENLDSKISNLSEKEILSVLKSNQEVNVVEMIKLIKQEVLKSLYK